MVEEPFVNLRTAIESTRQAVLLKYYNELLELDPKTQPKQITAVTRCVDTLERHSREQEEQQTDNDIDKMIAEGRLPGEYVQRYRWCKRAAYYFSSIVSAIDETDAYDLPEGEKHPYEEFASRFWEEVARRYWAAKDEVKKDMEEKRKQWKQGRLGKYSRRKKKGAPVAQSSSCAAYTSASFSQRIFPASARFAAARNGMVHGIGKRFF